VALVAENRRQRQPARRQDRPWSHGNDDGVAFDDLAARQRHAAHGSARPAHHVDDRAVVQHRAMRLSGVHQTCRERARLDERCRLRRTEPARDRDAVGQPRPSVRTVRGIALDGVAAVGRQTPITPRIAELGGKFGMELEAPPRQWIERAAAAPVQRQKAARLAGGRTGDGVTLYDGRPRAAAACEVGDRGADRATTADHDARTRAHSNYRVRLGSPVRGQPRDRQGANAHKGWPANASASRRSPPVEHLAKRAEDRAGAERLQNPSPGLKPRRACGHIALCQLLANVCIAACRVASCPCGSVRSSWSPA